MLECFRTDITLESLNANVMNDCHVCFEAAFLSKVLGTNVTMKASDVTKPMNSRQVRLQRALVIKALRADVTLKGHHFTNTVSSSHVNTHVSWS